MSNVHGLRSHASSDKDQNILDFDKSQVLGNNLHLGQEKRHRNLHLAPYRGNIPHLEQEAQKAGSFSP